jgi:hypothetical protein
MFHVFVNKIKLNYEKLKTSVYLGFARWVVRHREDVADKSIEGLILYIKFQNDAFNPKSFVKTIKTLPHDRPILARTNIIFDMALEVWRVNKNASAKESVKHILSESGLHKTSAMKFIADKDGCYYDCIEDLEKFRRRLEELLDIYPVVEAGTEPVDLNNKFLLQHYLRDIKQILKSWLELQ